MQLEDIIDTEPADAIFVAWPDSKTFQVELRPLLAGRNDELMESARRIVWDEATMERRVVVDKSAYLKRFAAEVIAGWSGLTVADLKKLVLIKNIRQVKKYTGEVACTEKSKLLLLLHAPAFEPWVRRTCANIELFNAERETALKKN